MLKCTIKVFKDGEEIGHTKFERNLIFNEANNSLVSDTNGTSICDMDTCRQLRGSKATHALGNISSEEKACI